MPLHPDAVAAAPWQAHEQRGTHLVKFNDSVAVGVPAEQNRLQHVVEVKQQQKQHQHHTDDEEPIDAGVQCRSHAHPRAPRGLHLKERAAHVGIAPVALRVVRPQQQRRRHDGAPVGLS
eukprot:scaffold33224_cov129-Isochrysis_galbana.AAC.3